MMSIEAMKHYEAALLEAFPRGATGDVFEHWNKARQAIAEAEQEPVAWRAPNWGHSADEYVYRDFDDPVIGIDGKPSPNNEPLYTHPQPKLEPLTDEQIDAIVVDEIGLDADADEMHGFARAIEAAHGIKENT
jgi:hypothetical protein